jgi:HEAT repeat protein
MGLFGPPNVDKLRAKRNIEGLLEALEYRKDDSVRGAAIKALGEIGDSRAVEPLIAVLRDGHGSVRDAAAVALGEIGAPAVEPLIVALKTPGWWFDLQAAANGRVEEMDWGARNAAIDALAKINAPAVEPLIAALNDSTLMVDWVATQALGQIGDRRAVEPLIAVLTNGNKVMRAAAVQALQLIGDPRSVEPVAAAVKVLREEDASGA